MAGPGLPAHRVVGALPTPFALGFIDERGEREHDFIGGGIECALAVFEVEEHADAGRDQLLERIGRLNGLASEPALFRHDEHLKRGAAFQRVHQPHEPGAFRELRTGDSVIDVNM